MFLVTSLLVLFVCDVGDDDDVVGALMLLFYEDVAFDDYGIVVELDFVVVVGLFEIDVELVVMVNLFCYYDEVVGEDFEGMIGVEVY